MPKVFANFYAFGLWIYEQTDSTWKISLQRQGELLFAYLNEIKKIDAQTIADAMLEDIMKLKGRAVPHYLKAYAKGFQANAKLGTSGFNKRQN
ncbi:Radical SAM [hydrothermal vent metagenome]|uniref:Radical SAM n=1 Tax=hydrothermal vent metagenome TaxID=652676 RepID=A0A1W1CF37_9ZZZZ